MGRGRSGATKQGRGDSRSFFVLRKNTSVAYTREKKVIPHPFPPEVIDAFKKIDPKLFASCVI